MPDQPQLMLQLSYISAHEDHISWWNKLKIKSTPCFPDTQAPGDLYIHEEQHTPVKSKKLVKHVTLERIIISSYF